LLIVQKAFDLKFIDDSLSRILATVPTVVRIDSEALARKVTRLSVFALATWTISAATFAAICF